MDIDKLITLENHAHSLAGYIADLIEFETNPNIIIPNYFESAEDYKVHIECMIGSYRILLGLAYNAIGEWRNV